MLNPHVRLEPLDGYRDSVIRCLRSADNSHRFRGIGPLTPVSVIDHALQGSALSAALVEAESDIFIGFAQMMAVDYRHGTAQLVAALRPEWQDLGWPVEGLRQFVLECFRSQPIRKLYCEVNGSNDRTFGAGLGRFFRREAVLDEHEWFRGELTSVVFYSLSRADLASPLWDADANTTRTYRSFSDFASVLEDIVGRSIDEIDEDEDLVSAGTIDSLEMLEIGMALSELIGEEVPAGVTTDLRSIKSIRYWFETYAAHDRHYDSRA